MGHFSMEISANPGSVPGGNQQTAICSFSILMTELHKGPAALSSYSEAKIVVACEKCGMQAQYDKAAMLAAGADRRLTSLLEEIARRKGCTKLDSPHAYDQCRAMYANLKLSANAYERAKDVQ